MKFSQSWTRRLQPGEGPNRGLLRDCVNFAEGSFTALMTRPPLGRVWRLINVERVWPAWQCYSVTVSHRCCPNSTKRRDDIIRFWLMAQTCHMHYVTRHQSPFFQTFFAAKTFITSNSAKAWSDCQTNTFNRTATLSPVASTVTPYYNTIYLAWSDGAKSHFDFRFFATVNLCKCGGYI